MIHKKVMIGPLLLMLAVVVWIVHFYKTVYDPTP